MNYRTYGKLGWQVSALGFGCMRLPKLDENPANIDEEVSTRLLHHAIDQGVNYVDTAYRYHEGNSESFLGRALQGGYRQKVHLATKLPGWLFVDSDERDFDKFLTEQMAKLQTDYLDIYLVHSFNKTRWSHLVAKGVLEWLAHIKQSGRVRALGFSFHDELPVFKQVIDGFDGWDMCQIQYNYMDTTYQAGTEGLRYAAARGMAVTVMEPLLGGKLVNPPDEVRRLLDPVLPGGRKPADLALQWVWSQPEVGTALSGMNSMQQVEENLASAGRSRIGGITPAEQQVLTAARAKYREVIPIPCTACGYCMPCPNGVNIPGNFEYFNKAVMLNNLNLGRAWYENNLVPEERANQCIDCDACEPLCPQNIPISDWMPILEEVLGQGKDFTRRP